VRYFKVNSKEFAVKLVFESVVSLLVHRCTKGETRKVWVGKPEGREQLEDLNVNGRIMLKWVLRKLSGKLWIGFM
jgi:hypothetical protein